MGPTDGKSKGSFTRRNILKLPGLYWFTSLCTRNPFAHAGVPVSSNDAAALPHPSRSVNLNGTWKLTYGHCPDAPKNLPRTSPPTDWAPIAAAVPGNVELDMVAASRLEPLERGNRVYQALGLESHQWWYRRSFEAGPGEPGEKEELVFEGLHRIAA